MYVCALCGLEIELKLWPAMWVLGKELLLTLGAIPPAPRNLFLIAHF